MFSARGKAWIAYIWHHTLIWQLDHISYFSWWLITVIWWYNITCALWFSIFLSLFVQLVLLTFRISLRWIDKRERGVSILFLCFPPSLLSRAFSCLLFSHTVSYQSWLVSSPSSSSCIQALRPGSLIYSAGKFLAHLKMSLFCSSHPDVEHFFCLQILSEWIDVWQRWWWWWWWWYPVQKSPWGRWGGEIYNQITLSHLYGLGLRFCCSDAAAERV